MCQHLPAPRNPWVEPQCIRETQNASYIGLHTSAGNMQCEQGFALAGQRNIVRASPCYTHNTVCDTLAQRPPDDRCATVGLQG